MKKSNIIIIAVVAVIVIAGGYAIFHKSPKPAATTTSSSSSSNNTSATAVNNAVIITKTNSSVGQYLADPNGNTLYTYGADTNGVSNCTGSCLSAWPAYQDKASTTNLPTGVSTITRTDNGQIQFTYNGLPLYFFASDSQGQVTGNGVNNFKVATPATTAPQSTPSSTAPTQSQPQSSGNPY